MTEILSVIIVILVFTIIYLLTRPPQVVEKPVPKKRRKKVSTDPVNLDMEFARIARMVERRGGVISASSLKQLYVLGATRRVEIWDDPLNPGRYYFQYADILDYQRAQEEAERFEQSLFIDEKTGLPLPPLPEMPIKVETWPIHAQ
jgi:hypothetical protein